MNTTIDTTIDTTIRTNDITTAHPGIAHRSTLADDAATNVSSRRVSGRLAAKARRLTLVVIAATSAILGGAAGLLPASEASAQAIVTPYFSLDSTVTCDPTRNTMRISIQAGAQPAYRGMSVQFQTYVSVGNSANWSNWSSTVQLWSATQQVANVASYVQNNSHVKVYVQMRYWTGYGWSTPQGTWATPYMISLLDYRTPYYNGFCYT